jgi:exfoliative toxin A/B
MPLIKKIPLPMAGLMLALAATGNLLESYGTAYKWFFGMIAMVLLIGLVLKVVTDPGAVREGLANPVVASVLPTFSMGLILLAAYLRGFAHAPAFFLWCLGIAIHLVLIVIFTKKHLAGLNFKSFFPSYFIVYVGIVTLSVTAPAFEQLAVGQAAFWFGFASFFLLLIPVLNRIFILKNIPEPAQPTMMILAAPMSLLLAGYLKSFPEKSLGMLGLLGSMSFILLILSLTFLPKLLRLKFYPSYSAFTFPLVISAIGMKGLDKALAKAQLAPVGMTVMVKLLEVGSALMVLYVLMRYMSFLVGAPATARGVKST